MPILGIPTADDYNQLNESNQQAQQGQNQLGQQVQLLRGELQEFKTDHDSLAEKTDKLDLKLAGIESKMEALHDRVTILQAPSSLHFRITSLDRMIWVEALVLALLVAMVFYLLIRVGQLHKRLNPK
jgi:predicted nuclease with TOPRIM domain